MSITDLDAATLARSLRRMAGDGSVEWVHEPMQTRVLLDVADLLDENAKLRQENQSIGMAAYELGRKSMESENAKLRELARDMYEMAYPERPSAFEAAFADRMRELGVEAGDA